MINHVADGVLAFKYENLSSESLSKNSKNQTKPRGIIVARDVAVRGWVTLVKIIMVLAQKYCYVPLFLGGFKN